MTTDHPKKLPKIYPSKHLTIGAVHPIERWLVWAAGRVIQRDWVGNPQMSEIESCRKPSCHPKSSLVESDHDCHLWIKKRNDVGDVLTKHFSHDIQAWALQSWGCASEPSGEPLRLESWRFREVKSCKGGFRGLGRGFLRALSICDLKPEFFDVFFWMHFRLWLIQKWWVGKGPTGVCWFVHVPDFR